MNHPDPLPGPPETIFGSDFRRGRLWTQITVTSTAAIWSGPFVEDFVRYGRIDPIPTLVLGFLAWLGLRGGRIITACFVLMMAPIFLGSVAELSGFLIQIFLPVRYWPDYIRYDTAYEDSHEVALAAVVSALATFSLWALLLSRNARWYRRNRRRQLVEQEANAFEWPPAHRRQG